MIEVEKCVKYIRLTTNKHTKPYLYAINKKYNHEKKNGTSTSTLF
jgi:hypothetical protein